MPPTLQAVLLEPCHQLFATRLGQKARHSPAGKLSGDLPVGEGLIDRRLVALTRRRGMPGGVG
ncbi:MAG: hypothetical protein CL858_19610, partial [Cupriavidus sp.]|nr:hypothetical protein [Cupriavidus sp.]